MIIHRKLCMYMRRNIYYLVISGIWIFATLLALKSSGSKTKIPSNKLIPVTIPIVINHKTPPDLVSLSDSTISFAGRVMVEGKV
jgi:hypothetical protein